MSQRRTPSGQRPAGPGAPAARPRRITAGATAGGRSPAGKSGAPAGSRGERSSDTGPSEHRLPATARLAPAPRAPTAPPRLSSRAAIVGLLVLAMLLAYAYPVRVYLNQQAEIAAIEAAQAAQRKHIAELMVERAKWDDDEYVKAQARKRLHFVLPGEKVYVIVDDPAGAAADAGHDQPPLPTGQWYEQVWDSLSGTPETGQ